MTLSDLRGEAQLELGSSDGVEVRRWTSIYLFAENFYAQRTPLRPFSSRMSHGRSDDDGSVLGHKSHFGDSRNGNMREYQTNQQGDGRSQRIAVCMFVCLSVCMYVRNVCMQECI